VFTQPTYMARRILPSLHSTFQRLHASSANTAVSSVVNGVLLEPLPYEQPGQLVNVCGYYPLRLTAAGAPHHAPELPHLRGFLAPLRVAISRRVTNRTSTT